MKINRYWCKEEESREINGNAFRIVSWGGSRSSREEAACNAKSRFKKIVEHLKGSVSGWEYDYRNTEIREPIVEESDADAENPVWVITRNRYGALVLNTGKVMFVDIDCAPRGCLAPSLSKSKDQQLAHLKKALGNLQLDAYVYETCAGFRLLVTNKMFEPSGAEAENVLKKLNSDKLYATLCRKHQCYRARLTPKPYRIRMHMPSVTVENYRSQAVESWVGEYTSRLKNFAVCRLVEKNRGQVCDPAIEEVRTVHDRYCLADSKPLA